MSTRARAKLWKLQETVRAAAQERDRLMRRLQSGRTALTADAHREIWMEFSLADQEYRFAVAELASFCELHGAAVGGGEPAA